MSQPLCLPIEIDLERKQHIIALMPVVLITPAAKLELDAVPLVIRTRIVHVFERLEHWPSVSGAKPLRGNLHGNYRIRTGDYRIVFSVSADGETLLVWKIGNRGTIYD